jgi:hypothetical protein
VNRRTTSTRSGPSSKRWVRSRLIRPCAGTRSERTRRRGSGRARSDPLPVRLRRLGPPGRFDGIGSRRWLARTSRGSLAKRLPAPALAPARRLAPARHFSGASRVHSLMRSGDDPSGLASRHGVANRGSAAPRRFERGCREGLASEERRRARGPSPRCEIRHGAATSPSTGRAGSGSLRALPDPRLLPVPSRPDPLRRRIGARGYLPSMIFTPRACA